MKPRYCIIRAKNLHQLAAEVDPKLDGGVWECLGAPFLCVATAEWCQAITRPLRASEPLARVAAIKQR